LSGSNIGSNLSLQGTKDRESQGDVKHNTGKTRTNSLVVTEEAILLVDGHKAVTEAFVLRGINTLHLSLHNIDGVVKHSGAETSEATSNKIAKNLGLNVFLQEFLAILEYHKADTLVGGLLQKGSKVTLVEATRTLFGGDAVNTMEKISVLRVLLEFIVDESGLKGFLRSNNESGLSGTSANTAHEVVELVAGSEHILLNVLVGTKADVVLGDGEQK